MNSFISSDLLVVSMTHCCKVGRVIDKYDLYHAIEGIELNEYLQARWLGQEEYAETGLRPLKDWLNQQLMKTAYSENERNALSSRIRSDYEGLTDDVDRIALLEDLHNDGIDGEQLQSDFISTATLYRHLSDCLEQTKESNEAKTTSNWEQDKVNYARDIVERNVLESLKSLENKGRLPDATTAQIKTDIILGCPECATQVSFERAVSRGFVCDEHFTTREPPSDE